MTRPAIFKNHGPSKTALTKAVLRKSIALGGKAPGQKTFSQLDLAEVLKARQKVDFLDPFMRHAAMQAKGISLCAFLVTLAAFQRGLKVTFHYERASFDSRFAKTKMQGHRGELFSISNGTRTHTFTRSLGDLTDPAANAIAEDKHLTKLALTKAGVRTPKGIVVEKTQSTLIGKFLTQNAGKRFVVKPYDGSMGQDVFADLTSEQVTDVLKQIKSNRIIIEEFISGIEYRALVVGDRYIASISRLPANVVGDGVRSIRQLIQEKNEIKSQNPRLSSNLIKELDAVSMHLKNKNILLETILPQGLRVDLLPVANISRGGDPTDTTDEASEVLSNVAVASCMALGLSVAGLDVIVAQENGKPVGYVIEANQRPHIGSHSFPMEGPGQGNAVGEAIVDYYFPETIQNRTHSNLAYDFAPIRAVLDSAQISELSLPVIGPEWRVLRFVETGIAAKAIAKLYEAAARTAGVFVMSVPVGKSSVELCLAYSAINWRAFMNAMPVQFRTKLEKLDLEVISPRN